MDKLIEQVLKPGGFLPFMVFIVPGFVAWRTLQLRRPQGEQKITDAAVDILVGSAATSILWYARSWYVQPATFGDATMLALEIFITPVVIAETYIRALDFASTRAWITSSHPRAWDYLFNEVARRRKGAGSDGIFLIVTLKNGDLVAGVYSDPGFASLWPYDRDLLLGQCWELDEDGTPIRAVAGSLGLYVDKDNIDAIQVVSYAAVVQSANDEESSTPDIAPPARQEETDHGN